MKKMLFALAVVFASLTNAPSAIAGPATDALSSCLADNTSGKDRKDMARWVYVNMSIHPEMQTLSVVTDKSREELDRKIAAIFTRLMTESCPAQSKMAMEKDGSTGFQAAFETIGKLAMQELMSNPAVSASFSNFVKYADRDKINAVFAKK